jgi:hypothetical protein
MRSWSMRKTIQTKRNGRKIKIYAAETVPAKVTKISVLMMSHRATQSFLHLAESAKTQSLTVGSLSISESSLRAQSQRTSGLHLKSAPEMQQAKRNQLSPAKASLSLRSKRAAARESLTRCLAHTKTQSLAVSLSAGY